MLKGKRFSESGMAREEGGFCLPLVTSLFEGHLNLTFDSSELHLKLKTNEKSRSG